MKAVILAAGKAERLGNLLGAIPKPMIKVSGKPILEHTIELCKKYGISEIYINVYHLKKIILDHFGDGSKWNVNITYMEEDYLHGTSGAVRKIAEDIWKYRPSSCQQDNIVKDGRNQEPFFVLYGDNLSSFNLKSLVVKSEQTNAIATIAFHYRDDISTSGVADFNSMHRITSFIEKPKEGETSSHWVNAGIYYLKPEILNYIPHGFSDFGKDIFPLLLKKDIPLYGICDYADVIAFDTPDMYIKNLDK
ncbi:nucleotidyltransferase family protein [bacterium]|nr:nucleotidyltransferase family protein [candidate division CSSED10-310 bacterium]